MQSQSPSIPHKDDAAMDYQDGIVAWDRNGIVIVWPDGHRSRFAWKTLRRQCTCPECRAQKFAPVLHAL